MAGLPRHLRRRGGTLGGSVRVTVLALLGGGDRRPGRGSVPERRVGRQEGEAGGSGGALDVIQARFAAQLDPARHAAHHLGRAGPDAHREVGLLGADPPGGEVGDAKVQPGEDRVLFGGQAEELVPDELAT
ncbi:hypothetical protein [Streptomyces buecherae]|uniref:hypothetical protein n=1 Tax=Streptomyces buecherae TaxID=2763006 RepID=UPI00164D5EA1|nr:hypothetical protein [Streptomyces buecherae]